MELVDLKLHQKGSTELLRDSNLVNDSMRRSLSKRKLILAEPTERVGSHLLRNSDVGEKSLKKQSFYLARCSKKHFSFERAFASFSP